jgi:hypothetical protein
VKVKSGIAFVCFFASCTVASAFEISTHEKLTAEAILRSALTTNPSLLSNLGLTVLGEGTYPNSDNTLRTANETIVYGAKFEDTAFAAGAVERVFNHFFDPQFNNFALRGRCSMCPPTICQASLAQSILPRP